MRFGIVALADPSFRVGTRSIEISQSEKAQSIGRTKIFQGLLDDAFGSAIRAERSARRRLGKRSGVCVPIDCGGGRKYEDFYVVPNHKVEQRKRICDVVAVIFCGSADRLANLDTGCEMHNRIDLILPENLGRERLRSKIAGYQFVFEH